MTPDQAATALTEEQREYPQREIFRRGGRYAMCQVMTSWTSAKDCPKYIACNDLERGDQFIAHIAMGTWCEVDVREVVATIAARDAEISRLREEREWQDISTAPRDGTYILVGNAEGAWIAKYADRYQSGYRPKNPWFCLMLNRHHMGAYPSSIPTHWMPLPAPPSVPREGGQ